MLAKTNDLQIQGEQVPWVSQYKYLGIHIQESQNYLENHETRLQAKGRKSKGISTARALWGYNRFEISRAVWKMVAVPGLILEIEISACRPARILASLFFLRRWSPLLQPVIVTPSANNQVLLGFPDNIVGGPFGAPADWPQPQRVFTPFERVYASTSTSSLTDGLALKPWSALGCFSGHGNSLGMHRSNAVCILVQILATLPKKRECCSPEGQAVHVIGNTDVPDKARRVLCLGPKFCNQPELSKPELLSMVRSTAARADAENVEGVIRDGVDCLRRSSKGTSSIRTEDTISALREANLKLLLSDKEGGFAIVPDDIYNQKAAEAITSNFTLLKSYKPEKTKKEAVKMCERLNLTKLASSVRNCKGLSLEAFFSAKTHKMACPFRVIVSERGTWQRLLGYYLQKSLFVLEVEDPYLVRTPSMVSDYLQQLPKGKVLAFSVDIKDLYYSLPHDSICETVNDGIDRYGPLKFQNSVGIAAEDFLNLLMLYLRSTTVVFRTRRRGFYKSLVAKLNLVKT
ncbi:hypothetical protein ISCGN_016913 [Ixodes scapularis]